MEFRRSAIWKAIAIMLLAVRTTNAEPPTSAVTPATKKAAVQNAAVKKEATKQSLGSNGLAKNSGQKKSIVQKCLIGKVKNVHKLGDLYFAGQPTPADLPLLKKQGIKTVITLRKPGEVPWDEAAAVRQLGMKYVQVPFQKPAELTPKVFDNLRKILLDKKRGPTLFHCGSANRVGAIWYAHRVLDGKLSPELALKEAQVIGLRSPALLEKSRAYVEAAQKSSGAAKSVPAKLPAIKADR